VDAALSESRSDTERPLGELMRLLCVRRKLTVHIVSHRQADHPIADRERDQLRREKGMDRTK
jgi:hypothetical protein